MEGDPGEVADEAAAAIAADEVGGGEGLVGLVYGFVCVWAGGVWVDVPLRFGWIW